MASLGGALRSQACPKLESLELAGTAMGDDDVMLVARALKMGGCPSLKRLDLDRVGMVSSGGRELAKAMGSLPGLQYLDIAGNEGLGDEAIVEIVRALASPGACHHLQHLGLSGTGLGQAAGSALVAAIEGNMWPELRRLEVARNDDMGDEVKARLVRVLSKRGISWSS